MFDQSKRTRSSMLRSKIIIVDNRNRIHSLLGRLPHKNHILPLYLIKLVPGTAYCIDDSQLQNDFFVHIISYDVAMVHDKEARKEWTYHISSVAR
jgi:hypothetical protein